MSVSAGDERIWDAVPIGIFVLSDRCRIVHWNRWLAERTGIPEADAQGKALEELFPNFHNPRFDSAVEQVLRRGFPQILSQVLNRFVVPIRIEHAAREGVVMMQQHVTVAPAKGHDGRPWAVVSVIDVTDNVIRAAAMKEMTRRLHQDSNRDPLTSLFNRRFMWEWLENQLDQCVRHATPLCCLMIDIDHFKELNDTFGHDRGDAIIGEFVGLLQVHTRSSDILVRYGGEEFVALLPHCALSEGIESAQRIVEMVRAAQIAGLDRGAVTCSVGVAEFDPVRPCGGAELLKKADTQLYKAKSAGRDRVAPAKGR